MKKVIIDKVDNPLLLSEKLEARCFESFFERFKGLMFDSDLPVNQAALFINKNETIIDSTIHMLFMNYDIAVFWLNESNIVVDKKIAKKWTLINSPSKKAQKILETHIEFFDKLNIGDKISIENI